jgi:hypothetical protein
MATTRVVVHIGPMKTGTTALGAYFSAAETAGVLPPDVVYPVGDLWFPASGKITKHGQLADFLHPEGRFDAGRKTKIQTPESVERKIRNIENYLAKAKGSTRTAVFICERLEEQQNLKRLVNLLTSTFDEVVLVLAIRSPVEAAKSLLVHNIKDWRSTQVDFDLSKIMTNTAGMLRFDYSGMITRAKKFGIKKLVLLPYFEDETDGYAIVDRFMSIVTGEPAPRLDDDFGSRRIHPSLRLKSLERLVILKLMKMRFGSVPLLGTLVHKLFLRTLFTDRDKVVRAGFGARTALAGSWVISDDERSRILDLYGDLGGDLRAALGNDANKPDWRAWFTDVGL